MKTVIDCNVLIAGGLTDGVCRRVIREVILNHKNYISDAIVREYRDVICRAKFKRHYPQLKLLLEVICENSHWYEGEPIASRYDLPDADDKIYLDLALATKVDYLITGNKKDFPLAKYNKVKIVSPAEWLSVPA